MSAEDYFPEGDFGWWAPRPRMLPKCGRCGAHPLRWGQMTSGAYRLVEYRDPEKIHVCSPASTADDFEVTA